MFTERNTFHYLFLSIASEASKRKDVQNLLLKMEDIKEDDSREVHKYFEGKSVVDTRIGFRIRTQTVP